MNEVNIFQSSVWILLVVLCLFFIWKNVQINKAIKAKPTFSPTIPEKNVDEKQKELILIESDIYELSDIINEINKEEELNKIDSIQRLMYFGKYIVDPILKKQTKIAKDSKLTSNRNIEKFKTKLLAKYPELSEQDLLLCSLVVTGISSKKIGLHLKLSDGTVRVYKNKLKAKLNVPNGLSLRQHLDIFIDEE